MEFFITSISHNFRKKQIQMLITCTLSRGTDASRQEFLFIYGRTKQIGLKRLFIFFFICKPGTECWSLTHTMGPKKLLLPRCCIADHKITFLPPFPRQTHGGKGAYYEAQTPKHRGRSRSIGELLLICETNN